MTHEWHVYTATEQAKIRAWHDEGISQREMGRRLGVTANSINAKIDRMRLVKRDPRRPWPGAALPVGACTVPLPSEIGE